MTRHRIVPLTRERYIKHCGEPPELTVKGCALEYGDDVLAIAGIIVAGGSKFIVFNMKEETPIRQLLIGWREFSSKYMPYGTYYALADESLPTSKSMLAHFGFEPYQDNIFIYRG